MEVSSAWCKIQTVNISNLYDGFTSVCLQSSESYTDGQSPRGNRDGAFVTPTLFIQANTIFPSTCTFTKFISHLTGFEVSYSCAPVILRVQCESPHSFLSFLIFCQY